MYQRHVPTVAHNGQWAIDGIRFQVATLNANLLCDQMQSATSLLVAT